MSDTLPAADEWNAAVLHSNENPNHILGPYEDLDGTVHMDCISCGWDSGDLATEEGSRR